MAQSSGGHLKLMVVTALGMVFGASLFGLYRFVAAESPEDPASWSSPGVARSGPKVSVEHSSQLQGPAVPAIPAGPTVPVMPVLPSPSVPGPALPAPSLPNPIPPVVPAVELPVMRPASAEVPVTPAPVEVKPPVPAELPAVKPVVPGPAIPNIGSAAPTVPAISAPSTPRLPGPTELGPFKLATPEVAPTPRPRVTSLSKPPMPAPSINKAPDIPLGPTAPLPKVTPSAPMIPPSAAPLIPPSAAPMIPPTPAPMIPSPKLPEPEKPLQFPPSSNTLKADTPGTPSGEVSAPKPAPFLVEPVPTPSTPAATYPAPMIPAPGADYMPMPTRQMMMSTALGVALALTPATTPIVAQTPPETPKQPVKTELDEATKKLLADLKKDIDSVRDTQKDFKDLVLGKANASSLVDQGLLKRVAELEKKIASLDETLKKIETTLKDGANRTSAYPGTKSPEPAKPAEAAQAKDKAYIRIVNEYPVEMSILINGTKVKKVATGTTEIVEVPPGSYSYELISAGAPAKTGTIKEGETITLRIN